MFKGIKKFGNGVGKRLQHRPILSFVLFLVLLLAVVTISNSIRQPKTGKSSSQDNPKPVQLFRIGAVPKMPVQGKVEKSGAITIMAQSNGIVQKIYKQPGETIGRGEWVVLLSTNYQGGNVDAITRQTAEKDYNFRKENFELQKEIIAKSRSLAQASESNDYELREITKKSLESNRDALNHINASLESISRQIKPLEDQENAGTISSADQANLNQLRSSKISLMTSRNSLADQLRRNEYTSNDVKIDENNDNPPVRLSLNTRDQALKNLELQEKQLQLSLDVSLLNLRAAQIREAMMYPATPIAGVVDRVFVREGEQVTPGKPLVSIAGNVSTVRIIALVSSEVARLISRLDTSLVHVDGELLQIMPTHISQEPTDGALHSVIFTLPDEYAPRVPHSGIVKVELPMGLPQTTFYDPYVPVDAVYQSENEAFVYVHERDTRYVIIDENAIPIATVPAIYESQGNKYVKIELDPKTRDYYVIDNKGKKTSLNCKKKSNWQFWNHQNLCAQYQIASRDIEVARSRKVQLGDVYGEHVMVQRGLQEHDKVVLDRNIIEGDIIIEQR